MSDLIKKWIREDVRQARAYHVNDATGMIKLDAMENPYRWPEAMVDDWLAVMKSIELNRYPDPHADELRKRLRDVMDVPAQCEILLGNGSDELIQMIVMALSQPGRTVVSMEPGFVMYPIISGYCNMNYVGVPLTDTFDLDVDAVLKTIEQEQPAVVFIVYPNNPTGNLFDSSAIHRIIAAAPGLVVLDEAYHVFAQQSFMEALNEYENLLVLRTVSKMGLAGLRLGFLVGNRELIGEIDKVRLPYNINVLTQASVDFALACSDVLEEQAATIRREREVVLQSLAKISGLTVFPSKANFILFRTPAGQAEAIFDGLRARGVLIKNMHGSQPALHDCLRVTVGSEEENRLFLEKLRELV